MTATFFAAKAPMVPLLAGHKGRRLLRTSRWCGQQFQSRCAKNSANASVQLKQSLCCPLECVLESLPHCDGICANWLDVKQLIVADHVEKVACCLLGIFLISLELCSFRRDAAVIDSCCVVYISKCCRNDRCCSITGNDIPQIGRYQGTFNFA